MSVRRWFSTPAAGLVFVACGAVACSRVLGFDELTLGTVQADGGAPDAPGGGGPDASATGVAITITSSVNPASLGTAVTFTATVTGSRGTPTGSVTFMDGTTTLGAPPISVGALSGTATVTTSALALGEHTIVVTHGGDAMYTAGASTSLVQTVNTATTTTLSVGPSPSSAGESVTLTATVTAGVPDPVLGTVTFKDGPTALGSRPLTTGTAVFETTALTPGVHVLTAQYDGTAAFVPSTSSNVTHNVTAPNCQGLPATCGSGINCCESALVPGGSFNRSYDGVTFTDASYAATVSSFRLDVYEVTVGRFRTFVEAGKGVRTAAPAAAAGAHPSVPGSGWDPSFDGALAVDSAALKAALKCTFPAPAATWTDLPGANETKALNCVTWYEALAFCIWDGGRLPTEAEWNYAAAGGNEQRVYPWSNPPSSTTLSDQYAVYNPIGTAVAPVGSKPLGNGKWGHADLGGNVWEWLIDWQATPYAQNPCNDCANLTPAANRAFRGGGYYYGAADLPVSLRRNGGWPGYRGIDLGVRCARNP